MGARQAKIVIPPHQEEEKEVTWVVNELAPGFWGSGVGGGGGKGGARREGIQK